MTAWVTVADVQSWLGPDVDPTSAQELANSATSAVRAALGRDLPSQTYSEYLDSNGTNYVMLPHWPIWSITAVSINGQPSLQPFTPNAAQPTYRLTGLEPNKRKLEFIGTGRIPRGAAVISVTWLGGYDISLAPDTPPPSQGAAGGLPGDIYKALQLTAAAIYNAQAADPNLASESTSGVFSGSFYASGVGAVPPGAKSLLGTYIRTST